MQVGLLGSFSKEQIGQERTLEVGSGEGGTAVVDGGSRAGSEVAADSSSAPGGDVPLGGLEEAALFFPSLDPFVRF